MRDTLRELFTSPFTVMPCVAYSADENGGVRIGRQQDLLLDIALLNRRRRLIRRHAGHMHVADQRER